MLTSVMRWDASHRVCSHEQIGERIRDCSAVAGSVLSTLMLVLSRWQSCCATGGASCRRFLLWINLSLTRSTTARVLYWRKPCCRWWRRSTPNGTTSWTLCCFCLGHPPTPRPSSPLIRSCSAGRLIYQMRSRLHWQKIQILTVWFVSAC